MKKRIIMLLAVAVLSLLATITASAEDDIKIVINNKELYTEVKPLIVDGRTMVPVRAIGEAMGCEVVWIASTRTVSFVTRSSSILATITKIFSYLKLSPT